MPSPAPRALSYTKFPRGVPSRPDDSRIVDLRLPYNASPAYPSPQSNGHTIILLQTSPSTQSRTYLDFDTKSKAMDAIVRMYEDRLKEITPMAKNITYDIQDLFRFLDNITDVSALRCVCTGAATTRRGARMGRCNPAPGRVGGAPE